jgi:predicted metalloendopeptidase
MNRPLLALIALSLFAGCSKQEPAAPVVAPKALTSGVTLANFDKAVRPQDDLFRHVNGGWLARTEIPADRSNYGSFTMLAEKSEKDMQAIIEQAAAAKGNPPGSEAQKVGDFYAAYMDEARAEELGAKPLAPMLASVAGIKSKSDLARVMAELGRYGVRGGFGGFVNTDGKKSDQYIIYLFQGGIGLPEREYYLNPKFKDKLDLYGPHIERMLTLAGVADARSKAARIVALENQLAKAHWTKEDSRDDTKTYNKLSRADLMAKAKGFDWNLYFDATGADKAQEFIVAQPSYFTAMAKAVDSVPLDTWKAWLEWNVVNQFAGLLSKEIVDADFAFYGTALNGTPENRPRWKRAVANTEGALGEAIGKIYVEKHFPPEAKARMDGLVKNLVEAYRQGIQELEWMSPETKQKALAKLATFNPKIGYPDRWRDYAKLDIKRDDLVGNAQRAFAFELERQLAKLGQPIDRGEWFMTPMTVNAYYNPGMNEIVFPAAILQPPFFDLAAEDAVNYGGIGAVIGHEIGHGFDDQGSKYDGAGNLNDWWTDADRKEFEKRAAQLGAQYDQYEALPGFKVNGAFTMGENIGDLAGVAMAHRAYRLSLGGKDAPVIDGYTGDQRFFIGWAQVWARKYRDDNLKQRIATDPHSPSEFRANGASRNVDAFYAAFEVKEGDKLYLAPEQRVRIW